MKYDFIEIGVADFDSEIQSCSEDAFGLTIEPVKIYLDKLPNKINVKKINCAVSDTDRTTEVYFVSPEEIKNHNLPWFIKGCNTIDSPHPVTTGFAFGLNIPKEIISKEIIEVKSFHSIIIENDVREIDYLKIDTEGHDLIIMNHYISLCEENTSLFAKKISFESNILLNQDDVKKVIERLLKNGYEIIKTGENTILQKK